ncbi:ABC transporter substrate-binding protein [Bradyrhizobium tropiciagri]|uniref:ABC transporter substrate-binding protein n=1 Tax=Bradyrhizobium tropiciagri TaxID=312253 RepID=UPI000AF0C55B|nr:ABC transporter substrate-binding protein [Bradyrhizobium tropiciagri]
MNRLVSKISRRSFLVGAMGVLAAPMVSRRAAAGSGTVTMVGWGGAYQEAVQRAVVAPFTKETGISVNVAPGPVLAKVKAMLLTGNIEWDLYTDTGAVLASGSKQGFWEKLDSSILEMKDLAVPPTSDYAINEISAVGITWDPKRCGSGRHPVNFAEFFDLKKFAGRHAMRPFPDGTLEIALLADGVAPKDMYPLDVDRAFKALDRIKPSVVWPATTPQSVSLVQAGEVDFGMTYVARAKTTNGPGGGVPLAFSFEQNVFATSGYAVVKGAPNKENAMTLIAYMLRPEVQARLEDQAGNTPTSKQATSMLSTEARNWQPDLSNPNSVMINSQYWADNMEGAARRFKEWIMA